MGWRHDTYYKLVVVLDGDVQSAIARLNAIPWDATCSMKVNPRRAASRGDSDELVVCGAHITFDFAAQYAKNWEAPSLDVAKAVLRELKEYEYGTLLYMHGDNESAMIYGVEDWATVALEAEAAS